MTDKDIVIDVEAEHRRLAKLSAFLAAAEQHAAEIGAVIVGRYDGVHKIVTREERA